jgi:Flp pilus assembly protein TadG
MMSVWTKFHSALRAFRVAQAGNVAITFVFATLPIIAAVGFAVDFSHANSVKAAMQAALDSTSLMISKEASTDTSAQLQTNAQKYFLALFNRPEAKNVTVTATYTTDGGTEVVINAIADVPTTLLGIIGRDTITVNSSSTSKWGMNRLRVALVLDNTGSMADAGKMPALQAATKSLLTQLKNAASTNGDVYVSIIPFVKDVNLGGTNWNSDYIYWGTVPAQDPSPGSDNNSWDANNGSCSVAGYSPRSSCLAKSSCSIAGNTTQSTCTAAGTCSASGNSSQSSCSTAGTCTISSKTSQSTCAAAGICSNGAETTQSSCTGNKACSKSQYTAKTNCQNNGGTWGFGTWTTGTGVWTAATWTPGVWSQAIWTPNNHNTWNGCVVDRGDPGGPNASDYDTNVASPAVTIMGSLYGAEQYGSCPQAVMPLNYNWTAMNSLVDNMSPAGSTNQAIGLQLGWLSLVGGGPFFAPPLDPNYTYTQVIILLTDGLNTQDRWYGNGSSVGTTDDAKIDAREKKTCANINAAGVTLYTIQVNTGGDATSTLLQNCAGAPGKYPDSSKFFLLTSASQIMTVFTQIGTNLSQLRVAK